MVFGWGRKRKNSKNNDEQEQTTMEIAIPKHFICPFSLHLMKDPVTISSGITYDRESIESWLQQGNFTCPVTSQTLTSFDQIPNHSLRKLIQNWCVENRNSGVERIPTPRIPVSAAEIADLISDLDSVAKDLDKLKCFSLLKKMKNWGNESERNRQAIVAEKSGVVLASAFNGFSTDSFERNADILEEILFLMDYMMFPFDFDTQIYLGSKNSLNSMVKFMSFGDSSSKHYSILALRELLACGEKYAELLATMEGINRILVNLIKDRISPTITKSSLMVIFHLLSSTSIDQNFKSEFMELGLIGLVLEIIVDSERNMCERALGVFDKLCDNEKGREEAYKNALTWPVLVKKILRVSELTTEFSVSAIWKLNKYREEGKVGLMVEEGLQVGVFQKLVLLLQVGCNDYTKEKATEILKFLNPYRNRSMECIDSVDFKNLKRSF